MQPQAAERKKRSTAFFRFFERVAPSSENSGSAFHPETGSEFSLAPTPRRLAADNDYVNADSASTHGHHQSTHVSAQSAHSRLTPWCDEQPQFDFETWPPSYHATQFLDWLQSSMFDPEQIAALGLTVADEAEFGVHRWWECPKTGALYAEILCDDIASAYTEFCCDQELVPHKWNTFAKHFNALLQGNSERPLKPYTQVTCTDTGKKFRLRCYRIPVPKTFRRRDELLRVEAA